MVGTTEASISGANVFFSPLDHPFLAASDEQIEEDVETGVHFLAKWLWKQQHEDGTAAEKLKWVTKLVEWYENEMRDFSTNNSGKETSIPHPHEFVAAVNHRHAPEWLTLEVHCTKNSIVRLISATTGGGISLEGNVYCRKEFHSSTHKKNLESYLRWLLEIHKHGGAVYLAAMTCNKNDSVGSAIEDLVESMGLLCYYSSFEMFYPFVRMSPFGIQDRISENLSFDTPFSTAAVPMLVNFQMPTQERIRSIRLHSDLRTKKKELAVLTDTFYDCFVVPNVKESCGSCILDTRSCGVIWLQGPLNSEIERMRKHFQGIGEPLVIKHSLELNDSSAADIRLEIFMAELKCIELAQCLKKSFIAAFALTVAAVENYAGWLENCTKDVALQFAIESLATHWRRILLHSDAQIGLSVPVPSAKCRSREYLRRLLTLIAADFESVTMVTGRKIVFPLDARSKPTRTSEFSPKGVDLSPQSFGNVFVDEENGG